MSADFFRCAYDPVSKLAKDFSTQAEAIQKMNQNLNSKVENLFSSKNWEGDNATAFKNEWPSVKASLDRLAGALSASGQGLQKMANITQQAEQQSANLFIFIIQA